MDNKLLNCPFCGGSDLFRAADNINSTDRVICKLCKGSAVLWKWNDRVTAQHPAVEALKEIVELASEIGCHPRAIDYLHERAKAALALTSQTPAETKETP